MGRFRTIGPAQLCQRALLGNHETHEIHEKMADFVWFVPFVVAFFLPQIDTDETRINGLRAKLSQPWQICELKICVAFVSICGLSRPHLTWCRQQNPEKSSIQGWTIHHQLIHHPGNQMLHEVVKNDWQQDLRVIRQSH